METQNILDIPMEKNDAKAATIRDYLKKLISTLWEKDEGFSGKRPFGNSGWKQEVYAALIRARIMNGAIDDDGYPEYDSEAEEDADQMIQSAIQSL